MKALLVVGARPNFVKVAPLISALRADGHRAVLLHTGQHFDVQMSDAIFADLRLPLPDYHLGVGGGTHAEQTARVMERFDPVLVIERPDWVVVVGDVNSTLATALVTAKRRPELGCRLAHVEAGLRSHDWSMPEEVNRVLTDRLADLLLTHSPEAAEHLRMEGVDPNKVRSVGNVMVDSLFANLGLARTAAPWRRHSFTRGRYGIVTLHRPSNVDDDSRFTTLILALAQTVVALPMIWPVHPRARARLEALKMAMPKGLHLVPPFGYLEMLGMLDGAAVIVTDSGGLQEESTALGVPCVTIRQSTERPITCLQGTNRLVPWPPTADGVAATVAAACAGGRRSPRSAQLPTGWDGHAAERIVEELKAQWPDS